MGDQPRYHVIYRYLLDGILAGDYPINTCLSTEKELCHQFSVSRITAKRALDMLAAEGYVQRIKGKGTLVLYNKADTYPAAQTDSPKLIGVILSDFNAAYGAKVLFGIERQCRRSHVFPVLRMSQGDIKQEKKAIDELLALGVSGLIILPVNSEYYNPRILQLILNDFPVVMLDRQMKGLDACFVGTDNFASTRLGTEYLLSLGHKSIAWITSSILEMSTLSEREAAFQEALIDNGIVISKSLWYHDIVAKVPFFNTPDNINRDIQRLADHFSSHPEITAVFASEYIVGLFVKKAAELIGYHIPRDLSIICYDCPPPLYGKCEFTFLQQQEFEIGAKAVSVLVSLLHPHAERTRDIVMYPAQLITGQSTGAAPANPFFR